MAQSDTVERILDTAEQLFAERGFAETSLRLITSRAGVNLAAVNYHFGSKKSLIQAVFSRFLQPFCDSLDKALDARLAESKKAPDLRELLEILVRQILGVKPRHGDDLSVFMRLLGLAFTQSQGHLRKYLDQAHGQAFRRFILLVHQATPEIPPLELFWRVHFMLGTAAFSMSGIKALRAMAENDFGVHTSTEQVLQMMVPFVAAGMQADSVIAGSPLEQARSKSAAGPEKRES